MQYRFYGKSAHMAADLQRQVRQVRAACPQRFRSTSYMEDRPIRNDAGDVIETRRNRVTVEPAARLTPGAIHAIAYRGPR